MKEDGKNLWFRQAFQLKGSVIPRIGMRVGVCTFFALIVTVLHNYLEFSFSQPLLSNLVPSVVLGLLLVFRTNTAYDRFWDGRKLWGIIAISVRNLSRQIWVSVPEKTPQDTAEKMAHLRLLPAFATACKLFLRGENVNSEIEVVTSKAQYMELETASVPPLKIAKWMGDYFTSLYEGGYINQIQFAEYNRLVDRLIDAFSNCQRISTTPLPLAYSIHLKHLLLIYCLALPFQMVDQLGWWNAPVVGLISFSLLGIEEIGLEIEDPFGYDPNDLPLDKMCRSMSNEVEELIASGSRLGSEAI